MDDVTMGQIARTRRHPAIRAAAIAALLGLIGFPIFSAIQQREENELADREAISQGFADADDRRKAASAGFTDAKSWVDAKRKNIETEIAAAKARWITLPDVTVTRWTTGISGVIADIDLQIRNTTNKTAIWDVEIECRFFGQSGTEIQRKTKTVYQTIQPARAVTVPRLSFGFINEQVRSVACTAMNAKFSGNFELVGK